MAFTVSSTTGTATATTVTWGFRKADVDRVLYVTYTKDSGEGGVNIKLSTIIPAIHATNDYQIVEADATTRVCSNLYYSLTSSGRYRIPITVMPEESGVKITLSVVSGTAAGTIVADLFEGKKNN